VLGLITACWIPYLMMTRHQIEADGAFGGWLMPVVPPMVSAASVVLFAPLAVA
jgi:tellurite resistance protein TehA-like permease